MSRYVFVIFFGKKIALLTIDKKTTFISDTSEKFTRNLNFESKSQSTTDFFQMRWKSKCVTFDTSVLFHRIKKNRFFFQTPFTKHFKISFRHHAYAR